jgi:hypothetical protein
MRSQYELGRRPPGRPRMRGPGADRGCHGERATTKVAAAGPPADPDDAPRGGRARDAAERAGLTISGYAASASLAAAAGEPAPDDRHAERLIAELTATRAQLRRHGNNLSQIARVLNAGGEAPEWVSGAVRLTNRVVDRIDTAVTHITRTRRTRLIDYRICR